MYITFVSSHEIALQLQAEEDRYATENRQQEPHQRPYLPGVPATDADGRRYAARGNASTSSGSSSSKSDVSIFHMG